MADSPQSPDAPDPLSSYSDPLYDRMEGVAKALGRKWWLIALLAIASAVVVVILQQRAQQSPQAEAANRLIEARGEQGTSALEAVARDDTVLAEFRARAALEAADRALREGEADAAADLLELAETQAEASLLKDLELTVLASRAAVHEQRGELEAASALYNRVADRTATDLPGLNLVAVIGSARCARAMAAETDDPDERLDLLRSAHERYSFAADKAVDGAATLIDYATFQRYDLERRHPELIGGEPLPEPDTSAEDAADGDGNGAEAPPADGD